MKESSQKVLLGCLRGIFIPGMGHRRSPGEDFLNNCILQTLKETIP